MVTIDVTTTSVISRKHSSRIYCRQTDTNKHLYVGYLGSFVRRKLARYGKNMGLHFRGNNFCVQRLACCAISASAELVVHICWTETVEVLLI